MRFRLGDLTIRNLIISYILLYSIMPIVQRLTSRYLTTYFYMIVVVVLVVLILVLDRPKNLNEYGTFLLPFILYGGLTFFTTSQDVVMWGYQTLLFWLPVIMGYYFTQDTSRIIGSYSKIIIFAMIITMITTIIGCIQNPNAARDIATTADAQDATAISYDMQNIGGYNFVYYMILLYPVLIMAYKTKKVKLLPTIILTTIILATVIYSEYTTALLLFVITSILFFTKKNLSARGVVVISIIAVLFLFVFSSVVSDFLRWLGDVSGSEVIKTRLDSLAGGQAGLQASEDNRIQLYQKSLDVFSQNLFFGTFINRTRMDGSHSFILDNLAQFGILGAGLMYFMYNRIFRRFFLPFKDNTGYGYVVWTFIQAIILSLVNTGMFLEVLCLFCPLLFYWIYGIPVTEEGKEQITKADDFSETVVSH